MYLLSDNWRRNLRIIWHTHFPLWALLLLIPWSSCSYLPEEQDVSGVLTVTEDRNYIVISPNWESVARTGLVFYPGGLVDPHAYLEPLSMFAKSGKGHVIVIVKMPGNLAIFDPTQGAYVFEDFPFVKQWFIGGHSLGGVMACRTVKKYPNFYRGLLLLAAYPQESDDLSEWNHYVLSVWGENDQILESGIIESTQPLLPPAWPIETPEELPLNPTPKSIYYEIPGGNHANFGHYGDQKGDGIATITPEEQTRIWVDLLQRMFTYYVWD